MGPEASFPVNFYMKKLVVFFCAVCLAYSAGAQDTSITEESFFKKNPSAKSIHWKDGGNKVVIRLKSGKTETYDLTNRSERAALTARYGSVPTAPPPPPPPLVRVPVSKEAQEPIPPPPPPLVREKSGEEPAPPPPPAVAPPPPPKVKKGGTGLTLCDPLLPVYKG